MTRQIYPLPIVHQKTSRDKNIVTFLYIPKVFQEWEDGGTICLKMQL